MKKTIVLGLMMLASFAALAQNDWENPEVFQVGTEPSRATYWRGGCLENQDWNMLLKLNKQYKPVINDLPKFPEVKRDFALLVDQSVKFADLAKAALATEKKLLKAVNLFDVYEGKNLEPGKKSYALSFILQDAENTLKDKQIEAIMAKLQKVFEDKFDAKLR